MANFKKLALLAVFACFAWNCGSDNGTGPAEGDSSSSTGTDTEVSSRSNGDTVLSSSNGGAVSSSSNGTTTPSSSSNGVSSSSNTPRSSSFSSSSTGGQSSSSSVADEPKFYCAISGRNLCYDVTDLDGTESAGDDCFDTNLGTKGVLRTKDICDLAGFTIRLDLKANVR